jgi:serine/threonine protein kinase
MAPELLDEKTTYTEKVDVYAFAMVIFETITRQMPWSGMHQGQIVFNCMMGKRPPLPTSAAAVTRQEAGKLLYKLMTACWVQDPANRPNFEQVVAQLDAMEKVGG